MGEEQGLEGWQVDLRAWGEEEVAQRERSKRGTGEERRRHGAQPTMIRGSVLLVMPARWAPAEEGVVGGRRQRARRAPIVRLGRSVADPNTAYIDRIRCQKRLKREQNPIIA